MREVNPFKKLSRKEIKAKLQEVLIYLPSKRDHDIKLNQEIIKLILKSI